MVPALRDFPALRESRRRMPHVEQGRPVADLGAFAPATKVIQSLEELSSVDSNSFALGLISQVPGPPRLGEWDGRRPIGRAQSLRDFKEDAIGTVHALARHHEGSQIIGNPCRWSFWRPLVQQVKFQRSTDGRSSLPGARGGASPLAMRQVDRRAR